LGKIIFVLDISTSQQTSATAEACLTEGWFLLEKQTLNIEKFLRYEYILEHCSLQIIIIQFFAYFYADSTNKTNSTKKENPEGFPFFFLTITIISCVFTKFTFYWIGAGKKRNFK
jgi:hypothetical protein